MLYLFHFSKFFHIGLFCFSNISFTLLHYHFYYRLMCFLFYWLVHIFKSKLIIIETGLFLFYFSLHLGLRILRLGFRKLDTAIGIWAGINISACLVFTCFNIWAWIRCQLKPKCKYTKTKTIAFWNLIKRNNLFILLCRTFQLQQWSFGTNCAWDFWYCIILCTISLLLSLWDISTLVVDVPLYY